MNAKVMIHMTNNSYEAFNAKVRFNAYKLDINPKAPNIKYQTLNLDRENGFFSISILSADMHKKKYIKILDKPTNPNLSIPI
jgi:hypothetical protein